VCSDVFFLAMKNKFVELFYEGLSLKIEVLNSPIGGHRVIGNRYKF
jgi:hypothetical protein